MNQADPSQPDLAWRGYSGLAMLPSFVLCGVLSLFLLMSSWFLDEARGVVHQVGTPAVFGMTWAIWIAQLFRWLYRGSTYIYRLTPKYLYIDRGFLYDREAPIDMASVTGVRWGADLLGRYVGVGWVAVAVGNRDEVTLAGVRRPAAFAEMIEASMKKAQTK
jgi:uncharacterized membrane protein YdbT with pleckstrin-like domain